ncbi:hypothetical protein [Prevotella sp. P5-108]|uniref:hypothetical protein n=1 Tax=Prevotella sp. P5-108 TaxID=2024225 RepID=UPI001303D83D|nr:hypothetical protein [Prevotella sp. P5-108]
MTPTVATFSASRQPLVACHHSLVESPNPFRHPPSLPSPPAITSFAICHHFLRIVRPFARHPRATSEGAHHHLLSVGVARHPSAWARHPSTHARKANGAA